MKTKTLLGVLGFLLPILNANAQTIKPLTIGDTVPDITLRHILNYKDTSAKLSDFHGKLLIIDFWATWCGSCLANFPRMDSLVQKYPGQLCILGCSAEPSTTVSQFFRTHLDWAGHPYTMLTLVADTQFRQYFPHRFIPHSVWIGSDGVVRAITSGDQVTEDKILAYLRTKQVDISVKKDQPKNNPVFLSSDFPKANTLDYYCILTKGPIYYGYGGGNIFHHTNGTEVLNGWGMTNMTLSRIYQKLAIQLFEKAGIPFSFKRMIETAHTDSGRYIFDCVIPPSKADSLFWYALDNLNRYSPYTGKVEKKKVKCLVLTAPSPELIGTKGGRPEHSLFYKGGGRFINMPLSRLASTLEAMADTPLPVVDATGYRGNVDLVLSGRKDLPSIRADLRRYGLELTEADREIDMFILSD